MDNHLSKNKIKKLPLSFYIQNDIHKISKSLLGKKLCTVDEQGTLTSGLIVETESYAGIHDQACHAYQNRRTKRTEPMFLRGGVAYVYLCYGMYYLLNVVTGQKDIPTASLIRAIKPLEGIDIMLQRRNKKQITANFTSGPGVLTQALGIDKRFNCYSFLSDHLWIEKGIYIKDNEIISCSRVGVSYAGTDALLPYRFILQKINQCSNC